MIFDCSTRVFFFFFHVHKKDRQENEYSNFFFFLIDKYYFFLSLFTLGPKPRTFSRNLTSIFTTSVRPQGRENVGSN